MTHHLAWQNILAAYDVEQLMRTALQTDIGQGDITTSAVFIEPKQLQARILSRTKTVACGLALAEKMCQLVTPTIKSETQFQEGDWLEPGQSLLTLTGATPNIFAIERCLLNFLMRLCGIATASRRAQQAIAAYPGTQIYDTRKTLPGWRRLDKMAVLVGGATNHRMGLDDAILIKDNHLALTPSLSFAVERAKAFSQGRFAVHVEVDTIEQLIEAIRVEPDVILVDNFSNDQLAQAVTLTQNQIPLEASGGITLDRLATIAQLGIERISMGALTHSVTPAELSLEIIPS